MNYLCNRLSLLGFAAALLLAGATVPALAQEEPATQLQQSGSTVTSAAQDVTEPDTLSAEKMDAYASSAVKITRIHSEMAPRIKATTDTDEKNEMFIEMQKQMISAVEETAGITVEEYNEISKQAINNPQMASRILGEVKSRLQ